MRRESDTKPRERTGRGRRARDRLLSGDPPSTPSDGADASSELEHLRFFVADDLREAALALGGIERFLVEVEGAVAAEPSAEELLDVLAGSALEDRLDELSNALCGLARSLDRLRRTIPESDVATSYGAAMPNPAAKSA
ncbi:MAG TPA: hypothetical protein VML75_20800 [Kofleriaceae bacterium]|nr:hypothetical protein [Kofleriaceae bacterium]